VNPPPIEDYDKNWRDATDVVLTDVQTQKLSVMCHTGFVSGLHGDTGLDALGHDCAAGLMRSTSWATHQIVYGLLHDVAAAGSHQVGGESGQCQAGPASAGTSPAGQVGGESGQGQAGPSLYVLPWFASNSLLADGKSNMTRDEAHEWLKGESASLLRASIRGADVGLAAISHGKGVDLVGAHPMAEHQGNHWVLGLWVRTKTGFLIIVYDPLHSHTACKRYAEAMEAMVSICSGRWSLGCLPANSRHHRLVVDIIHPTKGATIPSFPVSCCCRTRGGAAGQACSGCGQ
jgi:hypothetical protein